MKKKLLNVGASILTVTGMVLLMLTLVLTTVEVAQAQTETAVGSCSKGGGLCVSADCSGSCPSVPDANGKCPCT